MRNEFSNLCIIDNDGGGDMHRREKVTTNQVGIFRRVKKEIENQNIKFNLERINQLAGHNFNKNEIIKILNSLDIEVKEKKSVLVANVPPYRVDVTREADILEEILRVYGYNNLKISKSNKSNFLSGERVSSREDQILNNALPFPFSPYGPLVKYIPPLNLSDISSKESSVTVKANCKGPPPLCLPV